MRLQWKGSTVRIGAAASVAGLLFVIAIAWAASGGHAEAPPISGASPPPQASPSPAPSASPQEGQAAPAAPQEEPPPRIIRTVCTDRVCGGCDGKCRKSSGHVAVDKKGHCACTPAEGSLLDRAIRQAYEKRPPQ